MINSCITIIQYFENGKGVECVYLGLIFNSVTCAYAMRVIQLNHILQLLKALIVVKFSVERMAPPYHVVGFVSCLLGLVILTDQVIFIPILILD